MGDLEAEKALDRVAEHIRGWLEPAGTEDPTYYRGKRAGLLLALGIVEYELERLVLRRGHAEPSPLDPEDAELGL